MKLERLEISGFMHFAAPAVLDLRNVPPGLVALIGENGNGKTRLLDAGPGAVYGEFPSRDGNLADYATERDAYIDALFAVEGRGQYRSRINVDGLKRNSDAVLELVQPDGEHVPLSDGKVSTHREAVAHVFPAKELLLASAFAAQNRTGSFVTLKPAQRKDLFGKLIGLDHYAAMAATAKQAADVCEATRVRLEERRSVLARETADAIKDDLAARANVLQVETGRAELRRCELQAQIEELSAERETVAEQAEAHAAALTRVEVLQQTIAARGADVQQVDVDRARAKGDAAGERVRAEQDHDARIVDINNRDRHERDRHAALVKDKLERIAGNQTLNERADAIKAAAASKAEAETQAAALRERERKLHDDVITAREQIETRDKRRDAAFQARRDLESARTRMATLQTVPCGGTGACATCAFLTDAREAAERIPELEGQAAQIDTLSNGIQLWRDNLFKAQDALKANAIAIAQIEQRIKGLDAEAKYAPELAATEARIAGYKAAIEQSHTELTERVAGFEQERAAAKARLDERLGDIDVRLEHRVIELDGRVRDLLVAVNDAQDHLHAAEREADGTKVAAARLVVLDAELKTAQAAWTENETVLAVCAEKRATLDRERQAFVAKRADLDDVAGRLRTVEDRMLVWSTFVKAFGRDGLPTLEIAAAGPTVSNLTNDLLSACFGTRFTVDLVTQEARADKKGFKETFDLHVFDNEHGGDPRDIADLSGGERVIVDEALRAALALYVNSRNVAPIRTCWRDETTGALDPENATRYVAMLRRLLELGGFAHILFITHNHDAARLADTEIVVRDGQPEVVRRAA